MADFKLGRIRYKWRGAWVAGTDYIPDDIIEYHGKSYVCLVQHTADSDFYTDINFLNTDIPPAPEPKWLLMMDGYVWEGDWTPDTFYVKGNIVKYSGIVYLCVEPHTSASTVQGFASDISANWIVHTPGEDWKTNWAPSTYYKLNDVVKYFGIIYRCISAHTSAADFDAGIDPDLTLDKWEIVSFAEQWNGDWTASTRYRINDIVRYNGIVYRCTLGHTSSTSSSGLESDSGKWAVVQAGIEYRNDWTSTTRYRANDVVKYGADLWICVTHHISGSTFETDKWDLYISGFEYEYTWSSATVYQLGDVVRYGGYLFVANLQNSNTSPPQNPDTWSYLYLGTRIRGEWNITTPYFVGDLVRRQGQVYVAIADGTGHDTDLLGDGSTINSDYWELVVPGEKWQGVWQPTTQYVIGDVVNWIAHTYRCVAIHTSGTPTRPDNDTGNSYWVLYTYGTNSNRLKNPGDIKTYGYDAEALTTRTKALPIGNAGDILKTVDGEIAWSSFWESNKVYYVGTDGVDDELHGTTLNSPWRTVRYACEHVTGIATIFVKHGTYNEVLPIRVPAFVSVVGDEVRGVVVQPAPTLIPSTDVPKTLEALVYIRSIMRSVIGSTSVPALYSDVIQNMLGTAGSEESIVSSELLLDTITTIIADPETVTAISGTNTETVDPGILNALTNIENNREFIIQEAIGYINTIFPLYTFNEDTCARDLGLFIDAIKYDLLYPGNWKSIEAVNYYANAADGARNARQNMFLLRDGTGLRNMTLKGLNGEFTATDAYQTNRVTAGAYASLDPGWGPDDETAWVGTKSPYIQNVTNFGTKCIGLKVDGDLHNGGNQTIVANDFTQVLSDGIGAWVNGTGKSELVSVFTYYNHIGYLSENGGKIRATNGNNSYGKWGCIAKGTDITENPITALVNNQSYQAEIAETLIHEGSVMKLFYSNAGVEYSDATFTVFGSGTGAVLTGDEFRDNGVYEARIIDRGDSTALGGLNYLFITNNAQQGDIDVIRLAASDNNTASEYEGMRIFLQAGTGTGQYGYVAAYDFVSKDLTVGNEFFTPLTVTSTVGTTNYVVMGDTSTLAADQKVVFSGTEFGNLTYGQIYYVKQIISSTQITISETLGGAEFDVSDATGTMTLHSVGWQHITEGHPMETTLDTTTVYYIEPRVRFSSPGFSTAAGTMPVSANWKSVAFGNGIFVAVDTDTVATSSTGSSWTTGTVPAGAWRSVNFGNGRFVVLASSGTTALYSNDGITWSSVTIPEGDYRSVVYGNYAETWVAVSANTNRGAISLDNGVTWSSTTLSEGAEWNSVAFGNGKFVAVGLSDSTLTQTMYSIDGVTWSTGSYIGGCEAVTFGNGRFVAIDGTSSTSAFISLDGINWIAATLPGASASWKTITYGGGLFLTTVTGSTRSAVSEDGVHWTEQTLTTSGSWGSGTYGLGKFVVLGGYGSASTVVRLISTGATTKARAKVVSGKISAIKIWEPGSGYTSDPVIEITDPNATASVAIDVRTGSGVLANPTITNAGSLYVAIETTVTGNGYMDQYQLGKYLVVSSLSRVPRPGDNLFITGINDYTYRVLSVDSVTGIAPNINARLTIAKALNRAESPDHNTTLSIRQNYSQIRITGHDFLDIGLGNFVETNYPNTLNPIGTILAPENEYAEFLGGRVFYTSTDQDGNFRVGELFAVEQASGTVTLSADFFQLEGLEELQLGGIAVGGTGTVVREFSTDQSFLADSNNVIPTQRAIKAYVSARVSGGGSDARTGSATSGLITVGPDSITTTTGGQIDIPVPVRFTKGVDGSMLALAYFMDAMSSD